MSESNSKAPVSFWIISIIMLLWNFMGVFSFYFHTFITDEQLAALPEDQAALYDEYPMWITIVFAIAVFAGTIGCIGLLMKKAWVKKVFIISLIAIIIQMGHNMFFTSTIEVYGAFQAAFMPLLVAIIGAFLVWYAGYCEKKGWIS